MPTLAILVNGQVEPIEIDYTESVETCQESYNSGSGARAHRTFYVDWEDRWLFCQEMLGYPYIGNDKKLHRKLPDQYPDSIEEYQISIEDSNVDVERSRLWATSVESITPLKPKPPKDANAGLPLYEKARVTLGYETLPFRVSMKAGGDVDEYDNKGNNKTMPRYVTKHVTPVAEYLTLPYGQFKNSNNQPIASGVGTIFPTKELQYIWHQVPFIPSQAARLIGKVNRFDFGDVNYEKGDPVVYPPGTLLLTGVEIKYYRLIGGRFVADLTYKIKHREIRTLAPGGGDLEGPFGHNWVLRYDGVANRYQWEFLSTVGGLQNDAQGLAAGPGKCIYDYADFAQLFQKN